MGGVCGPRGAAMVRRVRLPASTLRPHGASAAPGGGVCRPPGRTSESRCSSNTAQTPTMLWRGHMLMILARLARSESFWAVVKVRSPHTGPEVCYII